MKNLFLIIAFIGVTTFASAQGNLQFNQVKLVSTVETVPAGKVWKVEMAAYNGGNPILAAGNLQQFVTIMIISINSNNIFIPGSYNNYGYTGASFPSFFPIWLPAGTTLAAGTNVRFLSVIEFNIIP